MYTVKHSTVVFADIQGSSAIMQRDEVEGLASLQKFKRVITSNLGPFNGQLLHIWGDGCLVIFELASDALEYSVNAQLEFINNSWPLNVRFGINCGEVHITENNAFGNVVNLASHLESISTPGAVLLTECVMNDLPVDARDDLLSLGQFKFSKMDEVREIFAVLRPGLSIPDKKDYKHYLFDEHSDGFNFKKFANAILGIMP